jgi:hypothetical protein
MIVKCRTNFYLDHFLPRDDSWPEAGLCLEVDLDRAIVLPRRPDEELFPDELDRMLAGVTLAVTSIEPEGGTLRHTVADRVVDRVTVIVEREGASMADDGQSLDSSVQEEMDDTAIFALELTSAHCRVLSGQALVGVGLREYSVEAGRSEVMIPFTAAWFAGVRPQQLKPLPLFPGDANGHVSSGVIRGPGRGAVSFDALSQSVALHGAEPPVPASLLLTGEERIAQRLLREAVIAMASACEIASDQYLVASGQSDDPDVKRILKSKNASFAERRFHLLTTRLHGMSLKSLGDETYCDVERLYRARNVAAHRGTIRIEENGAEIKVDETMALTFLASARRAIAWLGELQALELGEHA